MTTMETALIIAFAVIVTVVSITSVIFYLIYNGFDKDIKLVLALPTETDCRIDNAIIEYEIDREEADQAIVLERLN